MTDKDTERAVLGAVMINNALGAQLIGLFEPEDFTGERRRIYAAMVPLIESGSELNPLTLHRAVEELDLMDLSQYLHGVPVMTTLTYYAGLLKHQTALRRLDKIGQSLSEQAVHGEDIGDLIAETENALEDVRRRAKLAGRSFQTMADTGHEALVIYDTLRRGDPIALPTGYDLLDKATRGGIQPGDTWVIASQTGQGKSSWALNAALQQARLGVHVALVSREMSAFENFARMHSAVSGVPLWKVKPGMSMDVRQQLAEWQSDIEGLPIWMNCQTGNISELRPQVREIVKNCGIQTLFIDYLQLITASSLQIVNRAQEVAMVSRTLKEIAMENNIGVFILSQFNRHADHGERPELFHLAESSGIEKDASLVLILQMLNRQEGDQEWDCQMRIAKHRNGPLLTFPYRYSGETLTFKSVA